MSEATASHDRVIPRGSRRQCGGITVANAWIAMTTTSIAQVQDDDGADSWVHALGILLMMLALPLTLPLTLPLALLGAWG
jgi:hypothetical protein